MKGEREREGEKEKEREREIEREGERGRERERILIYHSSIHFPWRLHRFLWAVTATDCLEVVQLPWIVGRRLP